MKNNNKLVLRIIWYVIVAFVGYFFVDTLAANRSALAGYEYTISYPILIVAFFLLAWFIYYWWYLWYTMVPVKFGALRGLYYHAVASLTKYVPGKAGIVLTKIYYLHRYGVKKHTAFIISFYENLFQLTGALICSLPLLFLTDIENISLYIGLGLVGIVWLYIILHPKLLYTILNWLLHKMWKLPITQEYILWYPKILRYIALYVLWSMVNGFAFFIFAGGVTWVEFAHLPFYIALWNFSSIIWLLAIFVPGWLGVKEWIMVVLLQYFLPLEVAILISVLSRVWTVLVDGFVFLIAFVFKKDALDS